MTKEDLIELSKKIASTEDEFPHQRDLYLKGLVDGTLQGPLTGYATIDKPWLRFYDEKIFEVDVPNMSAYDFMSKSNLENDDLVALYYYGKKYTYSSLMKKIAEVENSLRAYGVKKGDIVSVALPNVPENVFVFYALNKIGAMANMVDLRKKGDMLTSAINDVSSKLMFGCDLFLKNIDEVIDKTALEKVVVVSPATSLPPIVKQIYKLSDKTEKVENPKFVSWNDFVNTKCYHDVVREKVDGDTPACILYTSGTTGAAKGVVLTNNNFNTMAVQYQNLGIEYNKGERFMNQVPTFLAYNLVVSTHMPLCLGLDVIMFPNYEPDKFAENVMKYKIKHVLAGPADWTNFLENEKVNKKDLSYLVSMGSGSDKINSDLKEKINEKIASRGGQHKVLEGYGQTEVSSAACTNLPNVDIRDSVGVPYPMMSIGIFDDDNCELLYGQKGNICISGPSMMKEYFNNPEATAEVMVTHDDGTVWIHTGDLGYMDENGVLYLSGRKKRVIVRHDGIKISPFDIEKVVDSLDFVGASCVVGVDDIEHGAGSVPCINIVPSENSNLSDEEMKQYVIDMCALQLTDKYCIGEVNVMNELPLTPAGKVDYRKLTDICNAKIKGEDKNVCIKK